MATIALSEVTVRIADSGRGRHRVAGPVLLDRVGIAFPQGTCTALVGPSGSGKTTVLRVIAGLVTPTHGSVHFDGVDRTSDAPLHRDVAMVFQQSALLPHRDVGRNVSLPLEIRDLPIAEIRDRVGAETRALHIEDLVRRAPVQLSAGEEQLVQIARAMVRVPAVLLLDEPLSRLDAATRTVLRAELRMLQQGYGVTCVIATNDPIEAMTMSDRIVVLDTGRVVQVGTPLEVHAEPATLTAAMATGVASYHRVRVSMADRSLVDVRTGERDGAGWNAALAAFDGAEIDVAVRDDGASHRFRTDDGRRIN